jgi:hypothetical protein
MRSCLTAVLATLLLLGSAVPSTAQYFGATRSNTSVLISKSSRPSTSTSTTTPRRGLRSVSRLAWLSGGTHD